MGSKTTNSSSRSNKKPPEPTVEDCASDTDAAAKAGAAANQADDSKPFLPTTRSETGRTNKTFASTDSAKAMPPPKPSEPKAAPVETQASAPQPKSPTPKPDPVKKSSRSGSPSKKGHKSSTSESMKHKKPRAPVEDQPPVCVDPRCPHKEPHHHVPLFDYQVWDYGMPSPHDLPYHEPHREIDAHYDRPPAYVSYADHMQVAPRRMFDHRDNRRYSYNDALPAAMQDLQLYSSRPHDCDGAYLESDPYYGELDYPREDPHDDYFRPRVAHAPIRDDHLGARPRLRAAYTDDYPTRRSSYLPSSSFRTPHSDLGPNHDTRVARRPHHWDEDHRYDDRVSEYRRDKLDDPVRRLSNTTRSARSPSRTGRHRSYTEADSERKHRRSSTAPRAAAQSNSTQRPSSSHSRQRARTRSSRDDPKPSHRSPARETEGRPKQTLRSSHHRPTVSRRDSTPLGRSFEKYIDRLADAASRYQDAVRGRPDKDALTEAVHGSFGTRTAQGVLPDRRPSLKSGASGRSHRSRPGSIRYEVRKLDGDEVIESTSFQGNLDERVHHFVVDDREIRHYTERRDSTNHGSGTSRRSGRSRTESELSNDKRERESQRKAMVGSPIPEDREYRSRHERRRERGMSKGR